MPKHHKSEPLKGVTTTTLNERKLTSEEKELEKLTKSYNRISGLIAKKSEKCIKLGVDLSVDARTYLNSGCTEKQYSARFDLCVNESELESLTQKIERCKQRIEKYAGIVEEELVVAEERTEIAKKETDWITAMKLATEQYQKWLAQFKEDCLKDGITIEGASSNYISGLTRSGKWFTAVLNDG